jgi:HK97 family phage major capsid protein
MAQQCVDLIPVRGIFRSSAAFNQRRTAMADLKALRESRGKLIADARAIVDAAESDKRAMSAEESAKFDDMMKKSEEFRSQIEREEKLRDAERELALIEERKEESGRETASGDKALLGFRDWLKNGGGNREFRDLSANSNTDGGYLVAPEQFVAELIKNIDDAVFIRQNATIYQVGSAASLGIPQLDTDPSDADWTTELQTGTNDTAMAFGKRKMVPHPLAKRIKVSNELLRTATLPAETIVRDRLAYKFAISMEKSYLTGTGNQQPLGIFTASADGIPTSRDISTENTTTAITADGLVNAKYALKGQYWANAQWLFHRDALRNIAKLKDGQGQYLWRESVRAGEPDTLLGRPVMMSEYAPNTFTTGLYVGIIGDFSNYWIADGQQMQMQRLAELYAEANQVGFIGRYIGDGAPVLAEAFARVRLA